MCVCLLLQDLVQSCLRGEGGILEDMCYERRRAEACVDGLLCPSRQLSVYRDGVCVYYCSTYYKAVREGGGEDMCYERLRVLCVFITAVPITKLFARGGGGNGGHDSCATRDYEPRPMWTSLPIAHY